MSTVVENKSLDHENDNEFSGYKWGVRHIQIVLCFLLLLVGYSMRVNISVAIVSMTSKSSDNPDIPVYDWDDQSLVLSSFYWGYFTLQIFAAYVGKKYGPKWFLVTVMTLNSILCALTPIMADNFGTKAVMAVRFLQGLSQGFLFPSVHTLLSNWAPKPERSRFSGFVYSVRLETIHFKSVPSIFLSINLCLVIGFMVSRIVIDLIDYSDNFISLKK